MTWHKVFPTLWYLQERSPGPVCGMVYLAAAGGWYGHREGAQCIGPFRSADEAKETIWPAELEHLVDQLTGGITLEQLEEAGGLWEFMWTCIDSGCNCEPCDLCESETPHDVGPDCRDYQCLGCDAAELFEGIGRLQTTAEPAKLSEPTHEEP